MSLHEMGDAPGGDGGRWSDLKRKGDRVEGVIVSARKREQRFQGEPVLSRAGKQRYEYVFTIQTGESDGPGDDGLRVVTLNEWGVEKYRDALRDKGAAWPGEAGATVVFAIVEDKKADRESPQQYLRAKYDPPPLNLGATVDDEF